MFNSLTRIMGDVDQENESKSLGSCEHLDAAAADHDDDPVQENPRKKKKKKQKCCSYRHTPLQIQELEARFKESSHPDEKQRIELGKRVGLEPQQVKFWFQNRRTLMKAQLERHENTFLKQENEKLRVENIAMREAMRNPMCTDCGCGPAIARELPTEEEQLKIENARLKDELDRVLALAGRFMHNPMSFSLLELAVGFTPNNLSSSSLSSNIITSSMLGTPRSNFGGLVERCIGRSVFFELAMSAMDELVKMAQMEEPLWSYDITTGKENLNYQEYLQAFPRCIGVKPAEFVSEATRDTGMVIINSLALVDTLMDAKRWADMFPGMIARAATTDIISSCVAGTKDGALQLMHAELQVLSPLVQTRDVSFLRYCKRLSEGVWAVVDVSIDETMTRESSSGDGITDMIKCRRLPSGCVVQDMPDGYSKVTWVEHAEYDDSAVHQLYRSLLRSGMGLGAQRWLATLQRRCECLAVLLSNSIPTTDQDTAITPAGRRSMLELAQRMMDNFCGGVCASSSRKWNKFVSPKGNVLGEDVRVMTRQSPDDPGEPPGVVLSAATSVWLPVSPRRLFDFLRDANLRSKWDVLSNGAPMQEVAHIAKGQGDGNAVSLLRSSGVSENQGKNNMLILQETCTDASGSLVVYAPVDTPAMHLVMNGGDSAVALLPSGFSIVTDGATVGPAHQKLGGSLLMVAFQILVNTLPSAKLTVESVETVSNLMSCTIQKIKAALHTED